MSWRSRSTGPEGIPLRRALATLVLFLVLAAPAQAARPHLLLFHGGSFLFEDPSFQPLTADRARAAGFVPHYVTYPLADMPAAVTRARREARRLRQRFGIERVYAYGSSAGGTLAALLSGDRLVAAAVAKAPVADLASWEWPLGVYGPDYFEQIALGPAARLRLSPLRRPARAPLLVYQGRGDQVVPPEMNRAFDEKFERVHLWEVPGGHTTERARPYLVDQAMHWLARIAALQARAAVPPSGKLPLKLTDELKNKAVAGASRGGLPS